MTATRQNAGATEDDVQQIRSVWSRLDGRKRIVVVLSGLAVFAGVLAMSLLAVRPSMKLLYAGLESAAAGDVVQSLEQRGIAYEVRDGSIFVPDAQRDELRLTLASEGLPTTGGRGYELLDSLNGFGTTSQMFDAAYWRAKEGELARTIVASRFIAQARVHIAHDGSNPFLRATKPTASVSVVPSGAPVTSAQADAIRYLVASAVPGLAVENVAVIDADGSVLGASEPSESPAAGDDRAQLLRDRVRRLLEARVGPGNAIVEVSVETVTESRSIRERRFDPDSRVAISTDVEERSDSSTNQAGAVTVASNLPDGDAAGNGESNARTSSTRERTNFEVSETETEIQLAPGAIRRLTVAVLVNGVVAVEPGDDKAAAPRTAEELESLRELVASAVGFDAERGDVITLKSMSLPAAEPSGTAAVSSFMDRLSFDAMSLVQIGVLGAVTLILGLFVVRPILTSQVALPPPSAAPAGRPEVPLLSGEIEDGETARFEPLPATRRPERAAALPVPAEGAADPVQRLRTMIGDRKGETVEILRSWLEDTEERV